jgi:hypothetical protein
MPIKIAHESPISVFEEVQKFTDYDYALVHLFDESPEYLAMFEKARDAGREIILDNSIFELGTAFDMDRYAEWIERFRPTWYIIPDVLQNSSGTLRNVRTWMEKYSDLPGKKIAVVQGKSYIEIASLYQEFDKLDIDMIAFPFDFSLYEGLVPHSNKLVSWMLGRVTLLGKLKANGAINPSRKHHLLGCSLPQEFMFYKEADNMDWIYSLDTSNPVVHGLKHIEYSDQGLWDKASEKLFTLINSEVSYEQLQMMKYNMQRFRWFVNGTLDLIDPVV